MDSSIGRPSIQSLREMASNLARRLGGFPCGAGYMCHCPAHADRSPSLSIRIGDKALLFKCFAGCDTLDVLRELRSIESSAFHANIGIGATDHSGRQEWLRDRARDLWDQARPVAGTLAERYLGGRSLRGDFPALRFCPRTPLGPSRAAAYRPALISALHDAGRLVAVQRTFLETASGDLVSDLDNPRRMLAPPGGGAVILAQPDHLLGLAEGVETALSAIFLLGMPVWATLGSERFAQITIPDRVTHLVILPDRDRAGRIGAARAMDAYCRPGRDVETVWPPAPFNDWNDVLRAGASRPDAGRLIEAFRSHQG